MDICTTFFFSSKIGYQFLADNKLDEEKEEDEASTKRVYSSLVRLLFYLFFGGI